MRVADIWAHHIADRIIFMKEREDAEDGRSEKLDDVAILAVIGWLRPSRTIRLHELALVTRAGARSDALWPGVGSKTRRSSTLLSLDDLRQAVFLLLNGVECRSFMVFAGVDGHVEAAPDVLIGVNPGGGGVGGGGGGWSALGTYSRPRRVKTSQVIITSTRRRPA